MTTPTATTKAASVAPAGATKVESPKTEQVSASASKAAANPEPEIKRNQDGQVIMYKSGDRTAEVNDTPDNILAMTAGGWKLAPVEE